MRNKYDKKILQAGVVAFLVVAACMVFYFVLFNSDDFANAIKRFLNIMKPVIIGIFLAYLLNPLMVVLETKIVAPLYEKIRNKSKKYKKTLVRGISIIFVMTLFGLFLYTMVILVVPQVISSVDSIINKFPVYANQIDEWIRKLLRNYPQINQIVFDYTENFQHWFMTSVLPKLQEFITMLSSGIIGGVVSAIKTFLNIIIGVIISIYILGKKELFLAQAKKIIYALLREERANNLINNIRFADKTFGGFISGKILDSLIVGVLCFFVLTVFKIPYPVLISVIVGVTNVIPYFGPFLGAIPSAIIILLVDPIKAISFIIIVLVLQQLDGSVIGPKILGDSTGLSSFWVIFSITLFGGYFGMFGMFVGVPLFAVIYAAIREFVNQRLAKKELPVPTTYYMENDYHSDEDNINTGSEIKFVKKVFANVSVEKKINSKDNNIGNNVDNSDNKSE